MHAKLSAVASRPVTYRRGAQEVTVQATVGQTIFRIDDGGALVRVVTRDFIIASADLIDFGDPKRGDEITETVNGIARIYRLVSPGGEPHWRWSGTDSTRLRIHTSLQS
jgi:hypothetical protein